ncbi:MAG TPA: helix-turn-helix domain-containing protein [Acidimicrobiales bacterium]|jgi:AcrR family transcriptional regulator
MTAAAAPPVRRSQAERRATTRASLLAAARALFAEQGYAVTGREEIAERAGVTRGALYHHFVSKADVFAAVVESLEQELVARVVSAGLEGVGVRDQLHRGCRAYIDACAEPSMARVLAEAPGVLGIEACRALDDEFCTPLLEQVFAVCQAERVSLPGHPEVVANLLLGLLNTAGAMIAASPHDAVQHDRVADTLDGFLERLFTSSD